MVIGDFCCIDREVMSHPVVTFYAVEKVSTIVNVLKAERHDGFPVIQTDNENVCFYTIFIYSLSYCCANMVPPDAEADIEYWSIVHSISYTG